METSKEALPVTRSDPRATPPAEKQEGLFGQNLPLQHDPNRAPRKKNTQKDASPISPPPVPLEARKKRRRLTWSAVGATALVLLSILGHLFGGMIKEAVHKLGGSYLEAHIRRIIDFDPEKIVKPAPPPARIETGSISVEEALKPPATERPPAPRPRASPRKPKKAAKEKSLLELLFPLFFSSPAKK
jgi:hypothetical protein